MTINRFADISNWQPATKSWLQALKNEYNVKSTCVMITQNIGFFSPTAIAQCYYSYQVFGSFSCYHFFKGNGTAEAHNFLNALQNKIHADKSTVVMIDAETENIPNLTAHINNFIDVVYNAGYHHIYVYSMGSMFNYRSDGIQTGKLHHGAKPWIASIGRGNSWDNRPTGVKVWQYTWTGNVQGHSVDLDYDSIGELSKGINEKPKKATYWQKGKLFEAKSMLSTYSDLHLKSKRAPRFGAKSCFYADVVKDGKITRLKTHLGYVSANTNFSHRVK
ncbi:GH25 family lysozyme [Apilactobacillus timberlakei]|uniref:Uncharacterized protein n=1 Tax=Apilactobacillus timberlakei TaxID=2008380 RepID=A0ABY2YRM0_9LACO|nr:GH25 family lysozyme [Apilactobacillus timberlakei]TPR12790.1 hypothetical protein DY048_07205 [Apilactobacillus timberlakei]TPR13673.1 hypothetical protein DY052_08075 [Apilactobacillus timberlakei]